MMLRHANGPQGRKPDATTRKVRFSVNIKTQCAGLCSEMIGSVGIAWRRPCCRLASLAGAGAGGYQKPHSTYTSLTFLKLMVTLNMSMVRRAYQRHVTQRQAIVNTSMHSRSAGTLQIPRHAKPLRKATSRHVSSPSSWLELSHHHSKTTRRIPSPLLLLYLL
jgi:hypothetical protein